MHPMASRREVLRPSSQRWSLPPQPQPDTHPQASVSASSGKASVWHSPPFKQISGVAHGSGLWTQCASIPSWEQMCGGCSPASSPCPALLQSAAKFVSGSEDGPSPLPLHVIGVSSVRAMHVAERTHSSATLPPPWLRATSCPLPVRYCTRAPIHALMNVTSSVSDQVHNRPRGFLPQSFV